MPRCLVSTDDVWILLETLKNVKEEQEGTVTNVCLNTKNIEIVEGFENLGRVINKLGGTEQDEIIAC